MNKLKVQVVLQIFVICLMLSLLVANTNADVCVESLTVAKAKVNVFEPLNISAVVRNGSNNELKGVVVRLSRSNPPVVIEEYSVNLPPKKDIGLSWTPFLPVGTHNIAVTADPDDAITESNEQNNVRTQQVTIEPVPLSKEALQHMREFWESKALGEKLGPFVILKPIRADLYPELWINQILSTKEGHVGVYLRNDGPDALPPEILDLVSVTVEFIGVPTDHVCTASLKGYSQGKPSSSSALLTINFYTDSTGLCPRALRKLFKCDPEAALSFWCVEIPELRLSVNPPTSKELFHTGYLFVDPKPYNNIRIEKKGKR